MVFNTAFVSTPRYCTNTSVLYTVLPSTDTLFTTGFNVTWYATFTPSGTSVNTGVISERTPEPPKFAISFEMPSTVTASPILPCNKDRNAG